MLHCACALVLALALQTPPAAPREPETPPPDDRPFAQLLANLVTDIKRLPSEETGLTLLAGGLGALLSHSADEDLAEWSQEKGESGFAPVGEVLGDGWTQAGAAVGTYAVGLAVRHRETTHIGSDLIRAQLLNAVFTRGLKIIVDRKRPSGGGHSLPSGHSSAAFATAGVLHGHFGWDVGVPAYAIAGYVGWSRVRDKSHWLSDVVIGSTIGAIVGRTVTAGHTDRSWTIVPAASRSGVAVYWVKK